MREKAHTVAEVRAELERDRSFLERRAEQEAKLRARSDMLANDAAPVVAALHAVGVNADPWSLVNTAEPYPAAIPVLVEHVQRPYHPVNIEGMVRALTCKEAKADARIWDVLVRLLWSDLAKANPNALQFAIANALSFHADKKRANEVAALAQDESLGPNRIAFYAKLVKLRHPRAREILEEAAHEDGNEHARLTLKRLLKSEGPPPTH